MLKNCLLLSVALATSLIPASAQMVSGDQMKNYHEVFRVPATPASAYSLEYVGCSTSTSNIIFPGDQPEFSFRIHNPGGQPLQVEAKAELIPFGTKGIAGDIWTPSVFANGDVKTLPVHVDVPAGGMQDIKLKFDVPTQMGGYAIVFDLGSNGRQFGTTFVRTYPPASADNPYPKMLLDASTGLEALDSLGVRTVRMEWGFSPNDPGQADHLDQLMKDFSAHHITVLMVMEAGQSSKQPFGVIGRPLLGEDDVMLGTTGGGGDRAWLPEQDDEFQKYVADLSVKYGWPKGPITAMSLWNEPWEGVSISGWGADSLRYREIYKSMALGVEDARKQGTQMLIIGCDSSTNSWDKLFADGTDDYLKWFDACTIHYQGIGAPSLYKKWLNRKGPQGRVQVWDTESWVANTDDRVATIVATDRAAGYDRGMGVFAGDVTTRVGSTLYAWPLAASVGAVQHFIGEREFKEFLFQKGLPWIFVFDGLKGNPDDGSVVIAGDLGEVLGENSFPFRTVRGLKEVADKEAIQAKLDALPADSPDRAALQKQLDEPAVLTGGLLSMPNLDHVQAYDFYGNPLPLVNGQIQIPLDFRGYYLHTDGTPGSFAKLLDGLRVAKIDGYEPLEIVAHDALQPFADGGGFRLTLTNILNRPIQGKLQVTIPGFQIDAPTDLSFTPFETKEIPLKLTGAARDDNGYPIKVVFDAGADGKAVHAETLHVNEIAKRTITVDGNLDDWKGVLPQSVIAKGSGGPTLTEAAWLPFKQFDHDLTGGYATAYMAHDDKYFYFAAKIADNSPDEGMIRYATMDPDQFFYPQLSYEITSGRKLDGQETAWTPADANNALRLSAADPNGHDNKVWSSGTNAGLGFFINAPGDHPTQLTLFLTTPTDGSVVQIVDQGSAKIALHQEIPSSPDGVYAVFTIKGSTHLTIRGSKGNPVALGGLFLDPAAPANPPVDAAATFVGLDSQTHGDWTAKYGKLGQWLAGTPAKLPGDTTIDGGALVEHAWPAGVRRFSYRKDAQLPSGNYPNSDNVQIAFNVLSQDDKITISNPPGTMPNFVPGQDTDYEFALNPIAPKYGGGTEIWRLRNPSIPSKNFYPREVKSPHEGAVTDGKLVITHDGNTRIVEAAIPWSEIPEVKAAADAGKTVKFSFRVNDNKGIGMELAEERSVSKTNPHTFHAEWVQHWGNELEFGFQK